MILFTKYSNERSRRFRIRTEIREEEGVRRICKTAASPEAAAHIRGIGTSCRLLQDDLSGTPLSVNECTLGESGVSFPYLEGRTLEEELDALLESGRTEELKALIRRYFAMFSACDRVFSDTPQFAEVFGRAAFERPMKCRAVSDVDMIFSNVLVTKEGWTLIDYEWTFAFPVPVAFLQYRCLHYYIQGNAARAQRGITEQELMEEFGIGAQEQRQFAAMEQSFQRYILGEYCPIWRQYDDISDGVIEIAPLAAEESLRRRQRPAAVCFDLGDGFDDATRREYALSQADGGAFEIAIPEGTKAVRFEPCAQRCLVRVRELSQEGRPLSWTSNGRPAANGDLIFDADDPQIAFAARPGSPVRISFRVEPLSGMARELILNQDGRIRWMEQTKAWRLYRKLKGGRV